MGWRHLDYLRWLFATTTSDRFLTKTDALLPHFNPSPLLSLSLSLPSHSYFLSLSTHFPLFDSLSLCLSSTLISSSACRRCHHRRRPSPPPLSLYALSISLNNICFDFFILFFCFILLLIVFYFMIIIICLLNLFDVFYLLFCVFILWLLNIFWWFCLVIWLFGI